MNPFCITRSPVISGGDLRDPAVLATRTVDGVDFFRLAKDDRTLSRILTGNSWRNGRPMRSSDVFANIRCLRDSQVDQIVNPPAAMDLGIEDEQKPRKRSRISIDNVPDVIHVRLPPIDGHGSIDAKILKGVGRDALWIELTPETLGYLAVAVRVEDADNDGDEEDGMKYISFCQTRQAFRVRFKGKHKWFPVSSSADALGEAKSHLAFLQSGSASTDAPIADA